MIFVGVISENFREIVGIRES